MPGFLVDKAFYHARLDAVVLSGAFVDDDDVVPGHLLELPEAVKGRGAVTIADVTTVQFADDREQLGEPARVTLRNQGTAWPVGLTPIHLSDS